MLGRGLLGIAVAFAVYAFIAAPASMQRDRTTKSWHVARPELLTSARRALIAVALAVGGAAILLWYAFFTRDFSIRYVAMNTSRAAQPWYTFSALWSGMAGSLLLWCLILGVIAAVFAARRRPDREAFVPWAIPVLAGAEIFFLAITTLAENPFARVDVIPPDGRGMNPLLHSPGMIIHPPLLYTGLVGMTVPFAIAVSALVTRRADADWIRLVRRWTLVPWLALGAGLVIGGAWAYTELGWGGYWGWDPVENAAFMPWLAATAFLHSAMVQERRGMLKVWNVFLITLAATLATFGTFLTRSGLLSSVHTFAESPIGKWFFVFLSIQVLVGLGLLVWRLPSLRSDNVLGSPMSKEALFLVNNLVFVGAAVVVLWGTVLPLATEALGGSQLAVGPPFFNRVMSPIGAILLLLASAGTVVPWRSGSLRRAASRLAWPAAFATVLAAAALIVTARGTFAGIAWIAILLATTSVLEIARAARARSRIAGQPLGAAARGLFARNPHRYGGYVVHLGVAIMVIGFAGSVGRTQTEIVASPGERFSFAGNEFRYVRAENFAAPDKDVSLAVLEVSRGGRRVGTLRPQLNFHRNWEQPQSEIAIRTTPADDVYVILAGVQGRRSVFRVHHNPLVFWVWAGAFVALLGG
ncbi:MAG TPA: heme lyase CcmF/NrfE family subunit, partial [Actinomycetota bacterium]|nr:heme lyase CcmF/NrfE family subunit [Actinomycetota bacterium]